MGSGLNLATVVAKFSRSEHPTERSRGAGQLQDKPRQGDRMEGVAGDRDGLTRPHQAEITVPQRGGSACDPHAVDSTHVLAGAA